MANRRKTDRNERIMRLWEKGWRQVSIANMLKMSVSAVSMVIWRENHRKEIRNENRNQKQI